MVPERPLQARVFFALWPAEAVRDGLHRAGADGARRFGGRATGRENLHLTLAFLGNVGEDKLPELHELAARIQSSPFDLHLDRLGFWGHNRILWAGCAGKAPDLTRLAEILGRQLQAAGYSTGLKPGRDFSPHVTLVRNVADKKPELPALPTLDWPCREFVLVRSRLSPGGSAYEVIGRWELADS